MKNLYNKINIHPFFYLLLLLSFFCGLFKDIICLFIVLFIHEIGHISMSILFKWNIKEVKLNITGGMIIYEEQIDKSFIEEFIIALSGILIQLIFQLILQSLFNNYYINDKTFYMFTKYNISNVLFNLIPIIPLDGSKILNILLNIFYPYKKSLVLTNYLSVIFLMLFIFIIKLDSSNLLLIFVLIKCIYESFKEVNYLFNRFLYERYKYPLLNKKIVIIDGKKISKMKRQKSHVFKINNAYIKEEKILSKIFDLNIKI